MLERARRRVQRNRRANVELVQADVAPYTVHVGVGGVLSTSAAAGWSGWVCG